MESTTQELKRDWRRTARAALVLVVAAVGLWFTLAVTVARLFGERAPDAARGWGLYDARAEGAEGVRLLRSYQRPGHLDKAREGAIRALTRDATVIGAASSLGMVADVGGDVVKARRMFHYSEKLSRRDVAVQLWLIEDSVRRDDIPGALAHYDRALRVSNGSREVLLPVLVKASADPAVARPLALILRVRPPWWNAFVARLLTDGTSPASIALLVRSLHLNPADESEQLDLERAMKKLIALGALDQAHALYRSVASEAPNEFIRNGNFEREGGLEPFDWTYVDEVGFGSFRQLHEGSQNMALYLNNSEGRRGEVARQLLLLAPGRYRLVGRVGGVEGEEISRPSIALLCADPKRSELASLRLFAAPMRGAPFELDFTVPAGSCAGQWLSILTGVGSGSVGNSPWIDSLSIRQIGS